MSGITFGSIFFSYFGVDVELVELVEFVVLEAGSLYKLLLIVEFVVTIRDKGSSKSKICLGSALSYWLLLFFLSLLCLSNSLLLID